MFDSRPTADHRGIGRYARCLLDALRATAGESEIVEAHRPSRRAGGGPLDVYHSPWLDGAQVRPPVPMVVTLHDLVPLKRRGEYLRTGMRFRLRYLAVQRAARVIVPTEAVRADAIELLGLVPEAVSAIAEAPAPVFHPRGEDEVAAVRERYALPERYLVWVGGLEHPDPRKRVAALAAAPRELPLVLVGRPRRWARELEGVQLTGAVSDDDLAAIYSGAHALVFPSDEEGFGLPPIEALACGTPVAACDSPAVREVLAGRAELVPVGDIGALIAAGEAAQRPAAAPPAWTWEDAAAATWRLYEEVAG
jgi:alpha-1,3-rhamnosyl/mannosyltransferase